MANSLVNSMGKKMIYNKSDYVAEQKLTINSLSSIDDRTV